MAQPRCRNEAGANLGPPALSLQLLPDDGVYVLEMSSYMLERLATIRFDAAAMLNLSPDHLDRHGDMAGYEAAKQQIFARQAGADVAVIGIDDEAGRAMHARISRSVSVSGTLPADYWCDGTMLRDRDGVIVDMRGAHALPGPHNAQNAAAAAALARCTRRVPRRDRTRHHRLSRPRASAGTGWHHRWCPFPLTIARRPTLTPLPARSPAMTG